MIDLHCHILPELDDGSQSLEESLAMARMAVNSGVRAMAATPHCMGERARSTGHGRFCVRRWRRPAYP